MAPSPDDTNKKIVIPFLLFKVCLISVILFFCLALFVSSLIENILFIIVFSLLLLGVPIFGFISLVLFILNKIKSKKQKIHVGQHNTDSDIVPVLPHDDFSASLQNESKIECTNQPNKTPKNEITGSALPIEKGTVSCNSIDLFTITALRKFTEFVVIDTETTGLNRETDRLIEIGIVEVKHNEVVESWGTLINPCIHISQSASNVNGLYDSDVETSPTIDDIIFDVYSRISGKVVVGYNVNFDLSFISRALSSAGINADISYLDAMRLVKKAFPGQPSYKLSTIANFLGYPKIQTHRAVDDAQLTLFVLKKSIAELLAKHDKQVQETRERKELEQAEREQLFAKSPLLNKTFVFTGDFEMDRDHLESLVKKVGAIKKDNVIKSLDYIVVGELGNLPEWAIARKIDKAEKYIQQGCAISKITERQYIQLIYDSLEKLK